MFSRVSLVAGLFLAGAFAAPADLDKRASSAGVASALQAVNTPLAGVLSGLKADASEASQIYSAILTAIEDTLESQVTATPSSVPQATAVLSSILAPTATNFYDNVVLLAANGFGPKPADLAVLLAGTLSGANSENNLNLRNPRTPIYPKKSPSDAPYSLSEAALRQVIHIPPTFTYGAKPPVILVPGSGTTGYESYDGNFIPLLTGVSYADPVWLNIPGQLLNDAQVNAEYVAYAQNYIAGITNKNVSVLAWSQGNIDTQWALKYWPSTRNVTSQLISISPDFHGTVLAYILCPSFPNLPCPPAVIQQEYNSNFIKTLRANGGDSAYVPTTTIFSATDEVVQPQSPVTAASAYINDARGVGVTNNQIQAVCGGHPAGTFYTHEGMLYNPLAWALAMDALKNGGPGKTSDIDLTTVCNEVISPGLNVADVLITEEAIVIAAISVLLYQPKVLVEPPIMAYAA